MCDESLPDELAEIERQLVAARRTESVVYLRSRVLGGVREQLRRDRRQQAWNFVAALAASALVWVNVSLSISGLTNYPHERTNRSAEVASWSRGGWSVIAGGLGFRRNPPGADSAFRLAVWHSAREFKARLRFACPNM